MRVINQSGFPARTGKNLDKFFKDKRCFKLLFFDSASG
nr:MAG TPA: hypothetical protein [Caudoviricetes sp.]